MNWNGACRGSSEDSCVNSSIVFCAVAKPVFIFRTSNVIKK